MKLFKLLATLGVGAVAGALLSPKKGSELRQELKDFTHEKYNTAKNMSKEDCQELVNKKVDEIKLLIDEFDVSKFKDSTKNKLDELKNKLDDISDKVQDSEQYSTIKETLNKVSEQIVETVNNVKEKVQEQELDDYSDKIEDDIDEIEEEIDVVLDDLKD